MQQMWVNFAKTGDPSLKSGDVDGVGNIKWDKYNDDNCPVMVLDSESTRLEDNPIKEQAELLEDLFWLRIKDD